MGNVDPHWISLRITALYYCILSPNFANAYKIVDSTVTFPEPESLSCNNPVLSLETKTPELNASLNELTVATAMSRTASTRFLSTSLELVTLFYMLFIFRNSISQHRWHESMHKRVNMIKQTVQEWRNNKTD